MTQSIHEFRKEKYCEIAKLIKPLIEKHRGVFLKLFNYSEKESPSDVDVFISPNIVLNLMKDFAKIFNARLWKRPLISSFEVILPKNDISELHLDLYFEIGFTPLHRVTSIERIIYTKIPWCRESLELPSPSRGFQAFFIMWHALKHQKFLPKDIRTLIELFDSFDHKDLTEFLLLIRKSKLELEYVEMLYILSSHILSTTMIKRTKQNTLRVVITAIKYLSLYTKRKRSLAKALYHFVARYKHFENSEYYDLKLLKALKTLGDFSRVGRIEDLYYLLRFNPALEYILMLLSKLGII
jgi:hypothetical protein